jgi:hypothetical protein
MRPPTQRKIENTTSAFSRRGRARPGVAFAFLNALVLIALTAVSAIGRNWPAAALSGTALLLFVVYAIVSQRGYRRLSSTLAQSTIDWSAAMPDEQRQHLNIEVRELSRVLETGPEQISDLQSAYVVAEDLALRQIQHEEGVPLLRHVSVAGIPFDAVYSKDGHLVCCEVSFLVAPELRADRTDSMIRKISSVARSLEAGASGARLMIILVTQLAEDDERALRSALNKRMFAETPVDIDIRLLDFEALQRIYVTDHVNS